MNFSMNSVCMLIFAVIWSDTVLAKSETATLSSVTSNSKSSSKVKRQHQYERPPYFSHYVGDAALDAARRNADASAQTINQVDQKDSNGNYNYAYETTNGIKVRQTSYMVGNNRVVVGYYSYIGPDGKVYTTHYTADHNGYRATGGSNLPGVQPLPFASNELGPAFVTPAPFISSTPPSPFRSSSSFNDVPSSTPYRPLNIEYSPTTASPIISSSTPFASTVSPFAVTKRPHFPIYAQPTPPFPGYSYTNPRINSPYSVVSQQPPAPVFFQSSTEPPVNRFSYATAPSNQNPRITSSLGPSQFTNDFNTISSTTIPFEDDIHVRFKEYIPPSPVSTPRPFNNRPDTILITPKPSYNQPRLPNSLSINQNLLPPYLSVGALNSQNFLRDNGNFIQNSPYDSNRPFPHTVAPLTVTNLNFRNKRNFEKH